MQKRNKNKTKKTVLNILYYVAGVILSLIFLFPLIYMIATSTKTEAQNAFDAGTIFMFIPNFNISQTFNNYRTLFVQHAVWKYINTDRYC